MTREEAIIELKKKITCTIGGLSKEEYNATVMAIEALSADTVSREKYDKVNDLYLMSIKALMNKPVIVRCKDCKHYEFADNRAFGMPVKYCDWFGFEDVDDNDFCSRGERKEE